MMERHLITLLDGRVTIFIFGLAGALVVLRPAIALPRVCGGRAFNAPSGARQASRLVPHSLSGRTGSSICHVHAALVDETDLPTDAEKTEATELFEYENEVRMECDEIELHDWLNRKSYEGEA